MTKQKQAISLLLLAVLSQLVILTDVLSGWIIRSFTTDMVIQRIASVALACVFWATGVFIIRKLYNNNKALHFSHTEKPTVKHMLFGLLFLAFSFTVSYISWGGLKVVAELMGGITNAGVGLGIVYFILQYLYYFLETVLFFNIIKYSQQAGELLFNKAAIPYGGIALAALWGLPHIIFQGVINGLTITFLAFLMGIAYLVVRKHPKTAFVLILLMFIL